MKITGKSLLKGIDREGQVKILEALLLEKQNLAEDTVDQIIRFFEQEMVPQNGGKIVARAWVDPEYKKRLLQDANQAIEELGFSCGIEGEHIVALENTQTVQNVVVCTLCSCYPWPILGLPPTWYKDPVYRARVVREPRKVLSEFGLDLGDSVEVRVWETSGHIRYFVLPMRPPKMENMTEDELASLITPEAMMGVSEI